MSFLSTGGITKLSQLIIDADKDWAGKGISNLKELALAMAQGDIIVRGPGGVLVRFPPGVANTFLTSAGPGLMPFWGPGGLYLWRYFPVTLYLSHSQAKNTTRSHTKTKNMPISSVYVDVTGDAPGSMLKLLTPAITVPKTLTKNTTRTYSKAYTPSIGRQYDLQVVVGGAIQSPVAGDTDETAAAQNATTNDMNLPPQTPQLGDAYEFGFYEPFDALILKYDTAGVGVWTITWKYWNGAWTDLAGVTDPTNGFRAAIGTYKISFTRPGDWALHSILGYNLYWIRAEVTAYTSQTAKPLGSQAWAMVTT